MSPGDLAGPVIRIEPKKSRLLIQINDAWEKRLYLSEKVADFAAVTAALAQDTESALSALITDDHIGQAKGVPLTLRS